MMSDPDDFWTDDDRSVDDIGLAVDDLDFAIPGDDVTGVDADEREVELDQDQDLGVEPDDY